MKSCCHDQFLHNIKEDFLGYASCNLGLSEYCNSQIVKYRTMLGAERLCFCWIKTVQDTDEDQLRIQIAKVGPARWQKL